MSASSRKFVRSAFKQNIYFTYVCLVGNIKPENSAGTCESDFKKSSFHIMDVEAEEIDINEDDAATKVERSHHEATEAREMDNYVDFHSTETEDSTSAPSDIESTDRNDGYNNPNTLKLTRMKWLSDSHDGSPDCNSLLSTESLSLTSDESDDLDGHNMSERHLSTILRLDREHNLFGLSHMTIVDLKPSKSKKQRKEEEKPVFPQTAIVQICCLRQCCRHKSRTSLPSSLRCGRCNAGCCGPVCPTCPSPCSTPCGSACKTSCPPPIPWPPKCTVESNCYGLQIKVFKKPKYEPTYKEIYPLAPCDLAKPFAARECHHCPRCIPPSPHFPYMMPCFWPSREGAPCSEPSRCFHNPPCPKGRVRKTCVHAGEKCPIAITGAKCLNPETNTTCTNLSCVGRNEELKKAIEARFGPNAPPPAPKAEPAAEAESTK